MNSLQLTSGYAKKAVIALMIISTLCLAAAAQRTDPQRQGRMYGDPGFRGEPINLNVVNADIRDILNYITEQYGINFVIDKSVASVPVTVNVSDVPWNIALDSILRAQDLGVQVNGTILRIASASTLAAEGEKYRLLQDTQLDTSPLVTEFVRLNYARAKDALVRGTSSAGTTTAGAFGSLVPVGLTSGTAGTASAAPAAGGTGLLPIIQRRLSRRGSIEVDGRSNSLIITDVRQNIDAIKQLIAILDQPEPQVEIEARIVAATRSFSREMGIQLAALVTGPRGSGAGGGTLPNTPLDPRITFPPSLPNGNITAPMVGNAINTVLGLTTGVFGTAQLSALISAGEQKDQAKVIATPRVTTLNNQKAKIESSTKIPIVTVQPTAGDAIATTTYVDVPLKLEITPQITDVGTVVLDVLAENASTATIEGGVAPSINSQTMETQVIVPDGGTTVVGGVVFDDERESQNRTPGLSKIPIFGNLFKRKGVTRDTIEILFFITPRVIRADVTGVGGQSGVRTSGTVIQPVPLGNPPSNSGTTPEQAAPATKPEVQPAAPVKP